MEQNEDFLTRQIRAIGSGLGVMISGKNSSGTEIVFPKKQGEKLSYQVDLEMLIGQHQFAEAADKLSRLVYAVPDAEYFSLSVWFYQRLNQFSEATLMAGGFSKGQIMNRLEKLQDQLK